MLGVIGRINHSSTLKVSNPVCKRVGVNWLDELQLHYQRTASMFVKGSRESVGVNDTPPHNTGMTSRHSSNPTKLTRPQNTHPTLQHSPDPKSLTGPHNTNLTGQDTIYLTPQHSPDPTTHIGPQNTHLADTIDLTP